MVILQTFITSTVGNNPDNSIARLRNLARGILDDMNTCNATANPYPSPVRETATVIWFNPNSRTIHLNQTGNFTLFSMEGWKTMEDDSEGVIPTGHLSNGLYLLRINRRTLKILIH